MNLMKKMRKGRAITSNKSNNNTNKSKKEINRNVFEQKIQKRKKAFKYRAYFKLSRKNQFFSFLICNDVNLCSSLNKK